jgi:hypothetical protein
MDRRGVNRSDSHSVNALGLTDCSLSKAVLSVVRQSVNPKACRRCQELRRENEV